MCSPSTPLVDVDIVEVDTPALVEQFFTLRNTQLQEVAMPAMQRSVSVDSGTARMRVHGQTLRTPTLATCEERTTGRFESRVTSVPVGNIAGIDNETGYDSSSSTNSSNGITARRPSSQALRRLVIPHPSHQFLQNTSPRLLDASPGTAFSSRYPSRLGTPSSPLNWSVIALRLADMGDQMNCEQLGGVIGRLTRQSSITYALFCHSAEEVVPRVSAVRWGSVAAVLFFSHWVALQLDKSEDSLYSQVLDWTVQYISDRFAVWIAEQGGWVSCCECWSANSFAE